MDWSKRAELRNGRNASERMKAFLAIVLLVILILFYYWFFAYFSNDILSPVWFDFVLHMLGGAWLAGIGILFLNSKHAKFTGTFLATLIVVLGIVAFFGVLWEFYEYLVGAYANRPIDPLSDVLSDLFAEFIAGTAIVAVAARRYISK